MGLLPVDGNDDGSDERGVEHLPVMLSRVSYEPYEGILPGLRLKSTSLSRVHLKLVAASTPHSKTTVSPAFFKITLPEAERATSTKNGGNIRHYRFTQ